MATMKVTLKQDPQAPIAKEVLAKAIVDISNAANALKKSGLNKRAIVVLVSQSAKKPHYVVEQVLDAIEQLKRDYTSSP